MNFKEKCLPLAQDVEESRDMAIDALRLARLLIKCISSLTVNEAD